MAETIDLSGLRVLILENEFLVATEIAQTLECEGVTVIGPFLDEGRAMTALEHAKPDCALIDINLGGGPTFRVANALLERHVPFGFVTGYTASVIPLELKDAPVLPKPTDRSQLTSAVADLVRTSEVHRRRCA